MDQVVRELELHEPLFSDEEIEAAKELVSQALRGLALTSSVITSIILSMVRRIYTSACDTMAVTVDGRGMKMMMINPTFAQKLGKEGCEFVLTHEAVHILFEDLDADLALKENPNWILATEACNNRWTLKILGRSSLPVVDGEPSGVDPAKVYDQYRTALKKAGEEPVSRDVFFSSRLVCMAELDRMPRPPRMKQNVCLHAKPGNGTGKDGDSDGNAPTLDRDEIRKLVGRALAATLHEAKANGNKDAANELLELMDQNPQAAKIWGDLGVGSLRGQTTTTRKTDLWAKWVADSIASSRDSGMRLRYPRKLAGVRELVGDRLLPNGAEYRRQGVVAIDASGSMSSEFLDKIVALIGDDDSMDVEWLSFDGSVWPFKPGEPLQGGGGTSFQPIDDYVGTLEEEPDFVLVITDGYAPKMTPTNPDSWIWLITPGGDGWPGEPPHYMRCRVIDEI